MRTLSSILLSSTVGRYIDHAPNRLKTLLDTITANRASVLVASVFWLLIVQETQNGGEASPSLSDGNISPFLKGIVFSLILTLGVIETLSGNANMLSMERDWVLTVAAPDGQAYDLTHLNSVMRRIDLVCKLVAPILISTAISWTSIRSGVLAVGGMSAATWGVEMWCAKRVWNANPRLRVPKTVISEVSDEDGVRPRNQGLLGFAVLVLKGYILDFKNYFASNVWIPSLSLSLLHISALAYSALFVTYLLNVGISLDIITIARAAGCVVEISSTVVTPVGVHYLAKAYHHRRAHRHRDDSNNEGADVSLIDQGQAEDDVEGNVETGLERLGLWGISWQLVNLVRLRGLPCQDLLFLTVCRSQLCVFSG